MGGEGVGAVDRLLLRLLRAGLGLGLGLGLGVWALGLLLLDCGELLGLGLSEGLGLRLCLCLCLGFEGPASFDAFHFFATAITNRPWPHRTGPPLLHTLPILIPPRYPTLSTYPLSLLVRRGVGRLQGTITGCGRVGVGV